MPSPETVPDPKTFSLLSIGQRGVGKTVFLAGSYAQLKNDPWDFDLQALLETDRTIRSSERPAFWFECPDQEERINLEKILNHVEQTGSYPPATIKITDFNFRLKQHTADGTELLCDFKWWDVPGELCDLRNADFQDMVLTSHGCCVFINAQALIHDHIIYAQTLEQVFNQVIAIASLAHQHRLNYAIALISTRFDLLESSRETRFKLLQNLQPLTKQLDEIRANYKHFYSGIPIVATNGVSRLQAKGTADSLLWLLAQLNKQDRLKSERNLASSLTQTRRKHPTTQSRLQRLVVVLSVISISLLGIIIALLLGFGLFTGTPNQAPVQERRLSS